MSCRHGYYKTVSTRYHWMELEEQVWVSTQRDISLHAFQCTQCKEIGYYSQAGRLVHEQGIPLDQAIEMANKKSETMNEQTYQKLQPHQQRIVDEKVELDIKREKLGEFKNGNIFPTLPWQEQERLNTQAHIMTMYSAILGERITAFSSMDAPSS